ncbi:MAG: 16S rRNA (adenine(1518)-N(6)/adenine(1519)-N(6))-dimethyltransferase, partial [Firmicutes bacterium]|nr:16S rRNA (adenine(1518)-N(6)/adenine(1519)-N(6))-dimethyltransferase [Candidatus Colimorpha enterica]
SEPKSEEYGALTATVRRYADVTRLFGVNAGSFMPAPKVDSAVVRISPHKEKTYSVYDENIMTKVIRGAFAQRRKNLANSLVTEFSDIGKKQLEEILLSCGFKSGVRGEELDTDGYANIANAIYTCRKGLKNDK